jgi:hypothetical protein
MRGSAEAHVCMCEYGEMEGEGVAPCAFGGVRENGLVTDMQRICALSVVVLKRIRVSDACGPGSVCMNMEGTCTVTSDGRYVCVCACMGE